MSGAIVTYSSSSGTAATPPAAVAGSSWSARVDGSGTVRVVLDASAADARLELLRGWRSEVGPDRLGPAVLEAFGAASLARLQAWATDPATPAALRPTGDGSITDGDADWHIK